MSPPGRRTARRVIVYLVIAVAVIVVVLVAMIGLGVLVLPSNTPAPVTISSVHLVIEQGTTPGGAPWFGPGSINYTSAEGYPIQVTPGGTWSVVWTFINFDVHGHNITQVTAGPNPPFTKPSTLPALPYAIAALDDDGLLSITVTAPSTPGATFAVTLTVYSAGSIS